jgi:hypothetical protein
MAKKNNSKKQSHYQLKFSIGSAAFDWQWFKLYPIHQSHHLPLLDVDNDPQPIVKLCKRHSDNKKRNFVKIF